MSSKASKILWISMIVTMIQSCSQEAGVKQPVKTQAPTIEAISIQEKQLSKQVTLPGELKPWNKVNILARVRGYVGQAYVDRGSFVKKGQVLVTLEAPEIEAELSNAKARYTAAQARAMEQEARLTASKLTYKRLVAASQTEGAISANEIDGAYSKMMADSAATVSSAKALEAEKALLASHQQLVNYLTIKAPFDGTITERNVSPGALVGPTDNPEFPLFVLEDKARLRLTVAIPENLANSISKEHKATFTVTANPGQEFYAQYARSANSLQESNRSMLTEFDVDNRSGELKSGMYAEVNLSFERPVPTLFVPQASLVYTSEGVYVIRIGENQRAEWVNVKKGNQIDTLVEIFGNIHKDETIALTGNPEIRNGQKVTRAFN